MALMDFVNIHVGNPKAFSTTIQTILLNNNNSSIHYLGFEPNSDPQYWYRDDIISRFLNQDLRFTNRACFNSNLDRTFRTRSKLT